jgi:hypothetical protein
MAKHLQMTLAVLWVFLLPACSDSTPPIGRGLPKTFAPTAPDFDIRVKQRFPVGSDEGKLLAELRNERFTIQDIHEPSSRYGRSALYESHDVACKASWTIRWAAEQGKITDIEGSARQVCL